MTTADEGMSLLDIYENSFSNEIDKESDTWKTFASIILTQPAFYKLVMEEVLPRITGNMERNDNGEFLVKDGKVTEVIDEAVSHLSWIFWDGSRPDGKPLGTTNWEALTDMLIQMKGLEMTHYG